MEGLQPLMEDLEPLIEGLEPLMEGLEPLMEGLEPLMEINLTLAIAAKRAVDIGNCICIINSLSF